MKKKIYIVVTPLRNGGPEPVQPGEPVELDAKEGDDLVALRALRLPEKGELKAAAPPSGGGAKPLAEQSLEELQATAKAERVRNWGLVKADAEKLRAAIEAHRTAKSEG